jgi:hypothetical protein
MEHSGPYGYWPAPPAGLPPHAVPPVVVRPRARWIAVGWLVFVVLTVVAVAVFVVEGLGGTSVSGPEHFFRDREPVPLPADGRPIVYVIQPGPVAVTCNLDGHLAEQAELVPVDAGGTVWVAGQEWLAVYEVERPSGSSLRIECDGGDTVFALATQTTTDAAAGAAAALFVLPFVGFVGALATTILVLARRRAARERLLAAWTGQPPGPRW